MDLPDRSPRFEYRSPDEILDENESSWGNGRIPRGWLARFTQPIVVLTGKFSPKAVIELAHEALGLHFEDGRLRECFLSRRVEELVDEKYERPLRRSLPPVTYDVRPGGLEAWRAGTGHFLAYPCNGCGRLSLAYWLETPEDSARALEIEESHPAIPFLGKKAVVQFDYGAFVGCFCILCFGSEDGRASRLELCSDGLTGKNEPCAKEERRESA